MKVSSPLPVTPRAIQKVELKKINLIFIFKLFCDASEGFMKALKALINPFYTTKKCENKNLSKYSLFVRDQDGNG